MKIHRGFHSSVDYRNQRVNDVKNDMPFRGAFLSKVVQGDGDSERVRVESSAGTKVSPFAYPFISQSAWIRGQPEPLTTMVSVIGGDTMDIQPIGYYDPAKSVAAKTYRDLAAEIRQFPAEDVEPKVKPYRALTPGELDIASGFAQTFFGKLDVLQARGGLSHLTLTSRESRIDTPLLTVHGHANALTTSGGLQDEVRYGTVRRSVQNFSSPTQPSLIKDTSQVNLRNPVVPVYAKEFSVALDWFGAPGKLLDHRQGNVVEDDGSFARSVQTAKALRARYQWYTLNGFTTVEIDDAGNSLFESSSDASEGVVVNVPTGDFQIKVGGSGAGGGKFSLNATNDVQLSTDARAAIVAERGFRLQTPQKGSIKAGSGIEITSEGGTIKINTPTMRGVKVGSGNVAAVKDQYPVLVAQPDYLSTLNDYYSAQTSFSQSAGTYGSNAAQAWAAVGPLLMLLDPSGVVMGLCQAAGLAAGVLSAQATPVGTAISQHLPRLAQMPAGFISQKLISE